MLVSILPPSTEITENFACNEVLSLALTCASNPQPLQQMVNNISAEPENQASSRWPRRNNNYCHHVI